MDGPVIMEEESALSKGDVTPLLKWIPESEEARIKAAFDQATHLGKLRSEAQ